MGDLIVKTRSFLAVAVVAVAMFLVIGEAKADGCHGGSCGSHSCYKPCFHPPCHTDCYPSYPVYPIYPTYPCYPSCNSGCYSGGCYSGGCYSGSCHSGGCYSGGCHSGGHGHCH